MRAIVTLVLFAFAPALAFAQPDSVHVVHNGVAYPGYAAAFGEQFPLPGTDIGPLPIVPVEGTGETAPPSEGCDPFVNADEVAGNVAFIMRGSCRFVQKVQNAVAAGAEAVVVYPDDCVSGCPGDLLVMGGDCISEVCSIPAVYITRSAGLNILQEIASGPTEVTLVPIRIYEPPTAGTHDTGRVQFDVFDQGFLGRDARLDGTGFVFDGVQGLYVSSVLVGVDGEVVSNPYGGRSEWTSVAEVEAIPSPFPAPFGYFDQGFVTAFENVDFGIRVTERSYSRAGDPFVIVELEVENVSGSDIADAYVGLFADFDAGSIHTDDAAGFEEDLNLVYVYDPVEAAPYFGVLSLEPITYLSGYSADATTANDAELFEALVSEVEVSPDPAERAVVIGVGLYGLAAGESARTQFAFLGGEDLFDLLGTALDIRFPYSPPAVEATTPEGTFALASAYPNPFATRTTLALTLPTAQHVRLAVYDVLGREVAVLVDGARPAGEQTVFFDASALPSGVYVVRLEAGTVRLTERVTVVR